MKLTFMGTGTSQGVPVIASQHSDLDLSNPHNWRMRTCAHLEIAGKHIQIDAGPEFRIQCLQNNITWIDLFILTHGHADHIAGMDDLRRFCDRIESNVLDVMSSESGLERVRQMFPYALNDKPAERGYPCFNLKHLPEEVSLFDGNVKLSAVMLPHGPTETAGLVFEAEGKKLAYYCDCKTLTNRAMELAKNADVLVIDALRLREHASHLTLFEAIDFASRLGAKRTYLIHTTSEIDYTEWEPKMPLGCQLAYDGLEIVF